jgi:ribosomal protein L40E
MRICPNCNSEIPQPATTCNVCAIYDDPTDYSTRVDEKAAPSIKICPSCNTNNQSSWAFCGRCGYPLNEVAIEKPKEIQKPPMAKVAIPPVKAIASSPIKNQNPSNPALLTQNKRGEKNFFDYIICAICEESNTSERETCFACGNPLAKTLPMGSQINTPKLRLIKDSGEEETYDITGSEFTIGRSQGNITFPQDNYMSSCHARIIQKDQRFFLVDENSKNGVYKCIKGELVLKNGDTILVGRQVLRFEQ